MGRDPAHREASGSLGPGDALEVDIADVATAMALAADLSLGQPLDHVLRSCAISMCLAERLGLSEEER